MSERPADRWLSMAFSVLLHGLLAAVFVYGWLLWKRPAAPAPVLAIDATVVDAKSLSRVTRGQVAPTPPPQQQPPPPPQAPEPEQAVPAPATPPARPAAPAPAPAPRRESQEAAQQARQRDAALKAEQQKAAAAQAAAERAAAERAAVEKAAAARAAAARAAADKAAADKAAALERERAASEADLRLHLAEEERVAAAQASGLQGRWEAQIKARIEHAWIRPPSARAGLDCTVQVTQVPGGEVVSARVTSCNGDDAVRQSIEAAVLRASPLPSPADPALFERNLEFHFRPNE